MKTMLVSQPTERLMTALKHCLDLEIGEGSKRGLDRAHVAGGDDGRHV